MSTLVAVIFKQDENGATNALTKLRQLEKEYLIDLEDAVIVRRGEDGKIKLEQSIDMTNTFALSGALWGSLIGLIFAGPLGWMIAGTAGAGVGALTGHHSDYGIDDNFIKSLSDEVEPCCSALFVLIRKMTADRVLEELEGIGGKIIKTSLSKDEEERLQSALQAEGKP
jgi:uncharacterized membrane protein